MAKHEQRPFFLFFFAGAEQRDLFINISINVQLMRGLMGFRSTRGGTNTFDGPHCFSCSLFFSGKT